MNRHRKLNDLKWLIESPSLLRPCESTFGISVIANINDWIAELGGSTIDSSVALKQINNNNHEICPSYKRLGRYAECLFSTWAEAHPAISLLDRGVQVRNADKQTLGELDFLLKINEQPVHLEMAVKYYLMADEKAKLSSFVGPNPRDRLDLKYSKLVNQQIQWLQKENLDKGYEFDTKLSEDQLNQEWERALLVKGMLFIHWKKSQKWPELPDEINEKCAKGVWCYKSEWNTFLKAQKFEQRWMPLQRLEWLSPARAGNESVALSGSQISNVIKERKYPLMVAGLASGECDEQYLHEKIRIVIVPDQWNSGG